MTHPRYTWVASGPWDYDDPHPLVAIGDEVGLATATAVEPVGLVTDIHGDSFGDSPDAIQVLAAAVTVTSGDRYPVADVVLLQRAGQ